MNKKEYRVIAETSDNNISYQFIHGNEETGWKDVNWHEISMDERKIFINIIYQGYKFFNECLTSNNSHKESITDKYNFNKHIWEGWTVRDFIDSITPLIETVIDCGSWKKYFTNKEELAKYCADNQPYYKKIIPEVVNYFADKYNIN